MNDLPKKSREAIRVRTGALSARRSPTAPPEKPRQVMFDPPRDKADPPTGPTPGCTCASHGLTESTRHGAACPYGRRQAQAEVAALQRAARQPVSESVLLEAQVAEARAEADRLRGVLLGLRGQIDRALDEGTFS